MARVSLIGELDLEIEVPEEENYTATGREELCGKLKAKMFELFKKNRPSDCLQGVKIAAEGVEFRILGFKITEPEETKVE